jgi:5-formyltetrahydrofolate cyclo-ligase
MAVRPVGVMRVGVADRLRRRRNGRDAAAALRAHFGDETRAAAALLLVAVVHRKWAKPGKRSRNYKLLGEPCRADYGAAFVIRHCVRMRYYPIMTTPSFESGSVSGATLRQAKRELRDRVLQARDALSAEDRLRAGAAIAAAIATRADFAAAGTVLLTLSFRSEWDTRPLVAVALAAGKTVGVPRVDPARRMLEACRLSDFDLDLAPGFGGITEPLPHCAPVALAAIDWVLVPGVAFDTSGYRVGYGGGYYDRLLPLLRHNARRISGALELQVVDRVPAGPHDIPVDAIVTEQRTLPAPPRR